MYVSVLLPIYFDKLLSYHVPEKWHSMVAIGVRVTVNIGKSKVLTGIVTDISDEGDSDNIKDILEVVDSRPIITTAQLKLWEWVAEYYASTLGEVMKHFFPSSMRIEGKLDHDKAEYSKSLSLSTVKMVKLLVDDEQASLLAKKAKAQYLAIQIILRDGEQKEGSVFIAYSKLRGSGVSAVIIKTLSAKGFIELYDEVKSKEYNEELSYEDYYLPELSKAQQASLVEIEGNLDSSSAPILFHAISGAGKSFIYQHLISRELSKGKNVLLLTAERGLSVELTTMLKAVFKDRVVEYTASISLNKRHKNYFRALSENGCVITGTRMVVGLPLHNLGLIIVDDEHEQSYKQDMKRPYFNGRDTATVVSVLHNCNIILASATPSIESYHNVERGKYGIVELFERYNGKRNPKVTIIDRRHIANKDKRVYGYRYDTRYLSKYLLEKMATRVVDKEQILLLHNRRGFASLFECSNCGDVPHCQFCNVTLTFHKSKNTLECHYCGSKYGVVEKCSKCGGVMNKHGIGAENVEEKVEKYFPRSKVLRIDADTISRVVASNSESDIIVGTQLVTKGFRFEKATLAGVVNIDNVLNIPDYRSEERTFQMMVQFAGRVSRHGDNGELIIQTAQTDLELFRHIRNFDYKSFYIKEINERKLFNYPPFVRLMRISMRHPVEEVLIEAVNSVYMVLSEKFKGVVSPPETPVIDRVRGVYIRNIIIKAPRTLNRELKSYCIDLLKRYRGLFTTEFNVDI